MRQCLQSEIAARQVEVANVVSRNANALSVRVGLDGPAEKALAEAARIQVFLEVLAEITSEKHRFKNAEVHVHDA